MKTILKFYIIISCVASFMCQSCVSYEEKVDGILEGVTLFSSNFEDLIDEELSSQIDTLTGAINEIDTTRLSPEYIEKVTTALKTVKNIEVTESVVRGARDVRDDLMRIIESEDYESGHSIIEKLADVYHKYYCPSWKVGDFSSTQEERYKSYFKEIHQLGRQMEKLDQYYHHIAFY